MPRRDGTGPLGQGSMSGRGLGLCNNVNAGTFNGRGFAYGRGFNAGAGFGVGRGNRRFSRTNIDRKSLLIEEKNLLQARLNSIRQELEDI